MNNLWDRVGISTSILCVVHCLVTPVLLMFLPLVGGALAHESFHALIIAVVVPVAAWALWNGYKVHRHTTMFWYAGFGFASILVSVSFGHDHDLVQMSFMVAAGILLAYAHFLNLRAGRCR